MVSYSREVAKRLFAQEFRESNLTFKDGDDQYSPLYLFTPTGAKVNRLFIVGTLIEKENIGNDTEYWRGRVVDPTGSFFIYAGQYQPEASQVLSECETPEFISILGKPNTYTTSDGEIRTSVRLESIYRVDGQTRDRWVIDTAQATLDRLKSMDSNLDKRSQEHYNTDPKHYAAVIIKALKSLQD